MGTGCLELELELVELLSPTLPTTLSDHDDHGAGNNDH